jgi:hypothetical protein
MYLIRLPDDQPVQWLFVDSDPMLEGCLLEIQRHVEFIDEAAANAGALSFNKDSENGSRVVLGRSIAKPSLYKRFIQTTECEQTDVEVLPGKALALSSWSLYSATCSVPHSVMLGRWSNRRKQVVAQAPFEPSGNN